VHLNIAALGAALLRVHHDFALRPNIHNLTKDPVCIPQHGAAQQNVVVVHRNVFLPRAHQLATEGVEPVVGRLELDHSAEGADFGWGIKIPRLGDGVADL
jgi:hypothetical protein